MVSPNLELQPILQLEDDLSAPQVGDVGAQADPLADVVSAHREVGQDALEGDGEDTDSDGQIEDLLQLFQEDLPDQPVGSNGQVAAEIVAPRDMSLDLETGPMIPAEVEEPAAVPGPLPADSADAEIPSLSKASFKHGAFHFTQKVAKKVEV